MKVVCISLDVPNNHKMIYTSLTIGKVYNVNNTMVQELYQIIDDDNELVYYSMYNFVDIKKYREDQLNKIFEK